MPALWFAPWLAAGLTGFRFMALGTVLFAVAKFVAALGIGFIVFQGVDLLFEQVRTEWATQYVALGEIAQLLSLFGVDYGVSLLFSAQGSVITWKLTSGALRRMNLGFLNTFTGSS